MTTQKLSIYGDNECSSPHDQEEYSERFSLVLALHPQVQYTRLRMAYKESSRQKMRGPHKSPS